MEDKHLALSWGQRVISLHGWGTRLQGVYLSPRSGRVTHAMVRRALRRRMETVPLDGCSQDAQGLLEFSPQVPNDEPGPARGSVPFTARTRAHCPDGTFLPLRGIILDHRNHRVLYLLVGNRQDPRAIAMNWVQKLTSGTPSLALGKADLEGLPLFALDHQAQKNASDALERAAPTGDTYRAVQVHVVDGTAHLTGHVRLPVQKADAEKAVASAKGVLNVQSTVSTDWDLELAIAEAMARQGLTRQGLVTVKSVLGRVRLSGHLATQEMVESAVAIATGVAGVRSVGHDIQVWPLPAKEPAPVEEAARVAETAL